jgi:hypothetical protein
MTHPLPSPSTRRPRARWRAGWRCVRRVLSPLSYNPMLMLVRRGPSAAPRKPLEGCLMVLRAKEHLCPLIGT